MHPLLADTCGRARMAPWAESLGIDKFDDIVMGWILGHVDEVVLWKKLRSHGEPKPLNKERTRRRDLGRQLASIRKISVVAVPVLRS